MSMGLRGGSVRSDFNAILAGDVAIGGNVTIAREMTLCSLSHLQYRLYTSHNNARVLERS